MVTLTRGAARAAWERAEKERAFWKAHQEEFLAAYPDQFVAVKDGSVVATGNDLDQLLDKLESINLEPTEVWLRYLNAHPCSTFF